MYVYMPKKMWTQVVLVFYAQNRQTQKKKTYTPRYLKAFCTKLILPDFFKQRIVHRLHTPKIEVVT